MNLKLNLTKEEVDDLSGNTGRKRMFSDGSYLDEVQKDWIAMYTELEVRAELIEKLEQSLLNEWRRKRERTLFIRDKEVGYRTSDQLKSEETYRYIELASINDRTEKELSALRTSINAAVEEIEGDFRLSHFFNLEAHGGDDWYRGHYFALKIVMDKLRSHGLIPEVNK